MKNLFYKDVNAAVNYGHALDDSFSKGDRVICFNEDLHDDIRLQAAPSFFRTSVVVRGQHEFPDVRPSFEDAIFIINYIISSASSRVAFLSAATYFYRKRLQGDSLVDTAWSKIDKYSTQIRDGYLAALVSAKVNMGLVPRWLQRVIVYDVSWHFKLFFNNFKMWGFVPEEARDEYFKLLEQVFEYIDADVFREFDVVKLPLHAKLGILSRFKGISGNSEVVSVEKLDVGKREVLLSFHHTSPQVNLAYSIAGNSITPLATTVRLFEYFGQPMVYETRAWVRWAGDGVLSCRLDGEPIPLGLQGERPLVAGWDEVVQLFKPALPSKLPIEKRLIRAAARSTVVRRRYQQAWSFMDRDTQADDNAEHLYRFLRQNHPEINAWFILRRSSHDWQRLSNEGFRLLEYGSIAHKLAMLNAAHLISSHADHYLFSVVPSKFYGDMTDYKFTFLQHGVTKDDLSSWLNSKRIELFITAAQPEHQSITCNGRYKFSAKEVALTGLPRHDRLLRLANESDARARRTVLIMPTWRQSLAGSTLGAGNARAYNPDFVHSEFFRCWQGVFSDPRLAELARSCEVRILLHPNLEPYIQDFDAGGIPLGSMAHVDSVQKHLAEADLLITDYSSIAFEAGYLGRSVLYFQFDRSTAFSGGHIYMKGYFDYDQHGFGPVAEDIDSLFSHISDVVANNFQPAPSYAQRMSAFFAFRDQGNCQRVFERIKALDTPAPTIIDVMPVDTELAECC